MSLFEKALQIVNSPISKEKQEILQDRIGHFTKNKNYKTDDVKMYDLLNTKKLTLDITQEEYDEFLNIVEDGLDAYYDIDTFLYMHKDHDFEAFMHKGLVVDLLEDVYLIVQQNNTYTAILIESCDYEKENQMAYASSYLKTVEELGMDLCDEEKYDRVRLFDSYIAFCDYMNDK